MFPFDPPENIRKPKVFWCFQGDQKGTFGRKGLTLRNNVPLKNNYEIILNYKMNFEIQNAENRSTLQK